MKEFYFDYYKAPFCILKVLGNEKGIFSIEFVKKAGKGKPNKITEIALKEIDDYFKKKVKNLEFPLDLDVKGFSKLVYDFIKKIPYGHVKTYKEVAKGIGKEKAARAVGQALRKNPLPLYFPCHRVVGSKGNLGGFSGGLKIKENLLKLEGIKLNELKNKFV